MNIISIKMPSFISPTVKGVSEASAGVWKNLLQSRFFSLLSAISPYIIHFQGRFVNGTAMHLDALDYCA